MNSKDKRVLVKEKEEGGQWREATGCNTRRGCRERTREGKGGVEMGSRRCRGHQRVLRADKGATGVVIRATHSLQQVQT